MALALCDVGKIAGAVLQKMAALQSAKFHDVADNAITLKQAKTPFRGWKAWAC
jgi:hypothetical protein